MYVWLSKFGQVRLLQQALTVEYLRIRSLHKAPGVRDPKKPRGHIVQLGDPVLRRKCAEVPKEDIKKKEIRDVLSAMHAALVRYDGVGLSAPQVGVALQILMIQVTAKQLDMYTIEAQEERQMKEVPLKVLFNPVITPVDNTQVIMRESCCSMHGFSGPVPRAMSVHVKGLNEDGEELQWKSSGWEARILQHEVDHLHGKMYIDRVDSEQLSFDYWKQVNAKGGDFKLSYGGIKKDTKYWFNPIRLFFRQG